jgi:hypothetical protein
MPVKSIFLILQTYHIFTVTEQQNDRLKIDRIHLNEKNILKMVKFMAF